MGTAYGSASEGDKGMAQRFSSWHVTGRDDRDWCAAPPSGRRGSRRLAAVNRPQGARLPKYSGATPLEPYLAQFRIAALHHGWDGDQSATQLALALEGTAMQVLLDLAPAAQRDVQALTRALDMRFGQRAAADHSRELLAGRHRQEGECLGVYAADILLYAQRGYPPILLR